MRALLIILLLPFTAFGQQMEWSNTRKLKGTTVFTRVIGENNNGIYLMRTRSTLFRRHIIFEKYRSELGFEYSRSVALKRERLVSLRVYDSSILVLLSKYNKETELNELSAYYINEKFEPITDPVVVDAAPIADFYDRGDFNVRYSVLNERLVIYHTEKSDSRNRIISMKVYDPELKLLGSRRMELPYSYANVGIEDTYIDQSGNVFMLILQHLETGRRGDNNENIHGLFCYYPAIDSMEDYQLNDTGEYLIDPHISFDREYNKLNVTAFYSEKFSTRFSSIYNFGLWLDHKDDPLVFKTELPKELISALIGKVRMERGAEVGDFYIIKTIPTSDAGLILIAERSSVSSDEDVMFINGMPQSMARNIYNYDDVLVLAMDDIGMVSWHHVINKNQSSMNDGGYFGSVIVGVTPSNIQIIYNDKLRGNGDIMQYTIDGKGLMTSKILLRSERNFVSVIPGEARQIGANELLLPTTRDKKFALLKLIYDK